jgi:preprotein translocase subunit SecD
MKTVRELLQDADPLQHEPAWPSGKRDSRRQAVLAAASDSHAHAGVRSRSRIAVFATVIFLMIAGSFLGSRVRSLFVSDLQGAIRFEVRLAEDKPAPGLREAKVSGSDRSIYLHNEVIVDNGDIAAAGIVQAGSGPLQYFIDIKFKPSGAEKMRAATGSHIGKPVAILLDGQVVMAPVLRSPIDSSAVVTGSFTRAQAERIVNGMGIQ